MTSTDADPPRSTTSTAAPTAPRGARVRVPGYPALIASIYGVCVLGMSASIVAEMALGYTGSGDAPRSLTEQLVGVLGFGTAGVVVSLGAVRLLTSPRQRQIGAVAFGALAVPALAFFWCGMPAMMGATAATLAGLTAGREREAGAARLFGLIGLVFAILNPVVNTLAVTLSWILDAS